MPILVRSHKRPEKKPVKMNPKTKPKSPKGTIEQDIDVVFICDVSGSMDGVQGDLCNWVNACVSYVKQKTPMARFSLIVYDYNVKYVYWRTPVVSVPRFRSIYALSQYNNRGTESTWDALGSAILKMQNEAPNSQTHFFLQTDFGSNQTSRQFTCEDLKNIGPSAKRRHPYRMLTTYFAWRGLGETLGNMANIKQGLDEIPIGHHSPVRQHTTDIGFTLGPNNTDPRIMGII